MSILIKGMKMPTSCWDCPMVSGYEIADEARTRCSTVRCRLTNTKRPVGEAIASNCPLVPVQPHGDLIDRNELDVMSWKEDEVEDSFDAGVMFVLDHVDELPAIIPAEEDET